MKTTKLFLKISLFLIIASISTTCKKDFLYEKSPLLEIDATSIQSFIVVLPDEEAENCPLVYNSIGNLKFKITKHPDWLILDYKEGKFVNDTAWIKCSAKKQSSFEKIGIYYDFMQIEDEKGKKYVLEVVYVTEGNPKIEVPENINFKNKSFQITNNADGILIWEIVECPEWLYFIEQDNYTESKEEITHGIIGPSGRYNLAIKLKGFENIQEYMTGQIVILCNDKNNPQKIININIDVGNPSIAMYDIRDLDFGKTETNKSLSFYNNGNGFLSWEFTDLPEWLSCSKKYGCLENDWGAVSIDFSVNRELISDVTISTTIYLRSNAKNAPNIPITVKVRKNATSNPPNVIDIDGTVKDAWYNKSNNKLYFITAQPNKFIEFNTNSKTIERSLNLSKEPNCFAISEDGTKAIVGHNGLVSLINMNSFSATKNISISQQIFDIDFSESEWCYYTETGAVQWTSLFFLNLNSEEIITSSINNLYPNCIIKKIPNKNYAFVTETKRSNGFYVFDLATQTKKAAFWDIDGNFWFIKNTEETLTENGNIYSTSGLINKVNSASDYLKMQGYSAYCSIIEADYCNATQTIWALIKGPFSFEKNTNKIIQFEKNNYSEINRLFATDFYIKNGTEYDVSSRYLFVNQQGTELMVFRNATNGATAWSIEFINIK